MGNLKSKLTHDIFGQLWDLKCNDLKWYTKSITAKVKIDVRMNVWNGTNPVKENTTTHTCKAGTKVRVWMVSRFGDVGITDNLVNPVGYSARVDPEDIEDVIIEDLPPEEHG